MRHLALLCVLGLGSCGGVVAPHCDMAETAADLAGEGATDCGHTIGSAEPDWACMTDAFEAGTPFSLGFQMTGIDSRIETVYVFNGSTMWVLRQDDYNGTTSIEGNECVEPFVGSDGRYDCTEFLPPGNHYQVCGAICGPNTCSPQPLPFPG